jgi:hypothetical protein
MSALGRVAVLAMIIGVLLAGCGNPGYTGKKVATLRTEGKPAPTEQAKSDEDRNREFDKCMAEHCVVLPKSREDAENFQPDLDAMRTAEEACRDLLPNGGQPPPLDAKQLDEMRTQAKCMREHGVDVPDPDPNNPYPVFGNGGEDAETMQKAFEACMGGSASSGPVESPAAEPTK